MKITNIAMLFLSLAISGCANTSAVMLEGGVSYPPTNNVQILIQAPRVLLSK